MGALHEGHLTLVRKSVAENALTVVSIFVNPKQFNNSEDLRKYPRTLEKDLQLLQEAGCDMVFTPTESGMYPDEVNEQYDFGKLERVMEGEFRPGHFNGVAVVVRRLFDIINPDRAYFGEKDYQQLCIIRKLVEKEEMPVRIIGCPIIREKDGLAMSSRNRRLKPGERALAPEIFKTLEWIKETGSSKTLDVLRKEALDRLNALPGMSVEYIQFADLQELQPVDSWDDSGKGIGAFVAVWLGEVRLIDNMVLIS